MKVMPARDITENNRSPTRSRPEDVFVSRIIPSHAHNVCLEHVLQTTYRISMSTIKEKPAPMPQPTPWIPTQTTPMTYSPLTRALKAAQNRRYQSARGSAFDLLTVCILS
jgi:hypothetical protein